MHTEGKKRKESSRCWRWHSQHWLREEISTDAIDAVKNLYEHATTQADPSHTGRNPDMSPRNEKQDMLVLQII